jgi:hypothetical protein
MNFEVLRDFRCVPGFVFFDLKAQNVCRRATNTENRQKQSSLPGLCSIELGTNPLDVGSQGISGKLQTGYRTLSGVLMAGTACIGHNHRNVSKVGPMTDRRFNSDLHGNPNNCESIDPAIAQGHIQWSALER